jgi:hypothetical protein
MTCLRLASAAWMATAWWPSAISWCSAHDIAAWPGLPPLSVNFCQDMYPMYPKMSQNHGI